MPLRSAGSVNQGFSTGNGAPAPVRRARHAVLWLLLLSSLVLLACAAWLYASFRVEIAAQYARIATGSRLVATGCGPVEVAEAGAGQPLLLVHGTGGGFDQAMLESGGFVDRGLRVIAPSRFGYLRTPFPQDASAEAQADQFVCLLDALGVERTAIIGISAGANSAMQFAIRHPQRVSALVLLVPAVYKPSDMAASVAMKSPLAEKALMTIVGSDFPFWFIAHFVPETAVRMVLATPPEALARASADERQRAERLLTSILPISARAKGMLNDAHIAGNPPRYALESIRTPTLVMSVRDDLFGTYASAQYTAQHISGARFVGFERGGHVWVGHEAEVLDQTAEFVRGAAAPDGSGSRR